jgi:hypothetical protein
LLLWFGFIFEHGDCIVFLVLEVDTHFGFASEGGKGECRCRCRAL